MRLFFRNPCWNLSLLAALCLAPCAAHAANSRDANRRTERRFVNLIGAMRPDAREDRERSVVILQRMSSIRKDTYWALSRAHVEYKGRVSRIFLRGNIRRLSAALRAELDDYRTDVLRLIENSARYPFGDARAQKRVDRKVTTLRQLWSNPYRRILELRVDIARDVSALSEIENYMLRLGRIRADTRTDLKDLAKRVNTEIRRYWTPPQDMDTVVYNRTLDPCISKGEIDCVKAINRYRMMLGRATLELDLRLVVTARGHSREMLAVPLWTGH